MESAKESPIRILCRFRPVSDLEENEGSSLVAKFSTRSHDSITVAGKQYTFDKIFSPEATQEEIYNESTKDIVQDVVMGYNGTIFAYGQTATGKTHTMEGVLYDPVHQGIIPRISNDIFEHISLMGKSKIFHVKVSYFEIYMEKIRDLLDVAKTNLHLKEDRKKVTHIKGVTEEFVNNVEEMIEVIKKGKANRHVGVNNMNEHSSRSHSILLINVQQEDAENKRILTGKLHLVDLAGSERISKSSVDGTLKEELKHINTSLSALGIVISSLADKKRTHVPYRSSKLTRILRESLGGNSLTSIILCCSPASINESETKYTLEFGCRAKFISNTLVVNEELTAEQWRIRWEKMKLKVSKLLAELRRWRNGESVTQENQLLLDELNVSALNDTLNDTSILSMDDSVCCETSFEKVVPESEENEEFGIDEECRMLYEELAKKDDELERLTRFIEAMQQQLKKKSEEMTSCLMEHELQMTMCADKERASGKDVMEVLYERLFEKCMELEKKNAEIEVLKEMLQKPEQGNKLFQSIVEYTRRLEEQLRAAVAHMMEEIDHMREPDNNNLNKIKVASQNFLNSAQLKIGECSDKLGAKLRNRIHPVIQEGENPGACGTQRTFETLSKDMWDQVSKLGGITREQLSRFIVA